MYDIETEDGIRRAEDNADIVWKKDAFYTLRRLAESRAEFTADDFWEMQGRLFGSKTHDNRALGPIFRLAVSHGWIERTDRVLDSVRRNQAPVRVWRSKIFTIIRKDGQIEMFREII